MTPARKFRTSPSHPRTRRARPRSAGGFLTVAFGRGADPGRFPPDESARAGDLVEEDRIALGSPGSDAQRFSETAPFLED
jgi:hypothetical protein